MGITRISPNEKGKIDERGSERDSLIQDEQSGTKPNRLINEKSPYLLQHAYNPVDWYAWGREAFETARRENKPIFLSIGYSSCHWCHVMEHESFEDSDVAKLLNDNFVCIKVDREELPDVDEIYMKAVISMTGSGGWPLSVFLTPSLEPFYGGTYFPPEPRYGMPSFSNIIRSVSQAWKTDRKRILESASETRTALKAMYDLKSAPDSDLNDSVIQDCYAGLAGSYDEGYGGFGRAPKFPTPSNLFFLMRYHKKSGEASGLALTMVRKTLDAMLAGGIYDQVGGGFHRYSTDRFWLVPHFEKMLYDNALLVEAYCDAYVLTKNDEFAKAIRETLRWILREMRSPEGGFYSSQDADSTEGEGAYYVWTIDDLKKALLPDPLLSEKWPLLASYYSITSQGNYDDGKTILTAKGLDNVAREFSLSRDELSDIVSRSKDLMFAFRERRPKPATDVKVITSWNGLLISALSRSFDVLGDKQYLEAATLAAEFLLSQIRATDKGKENFAMRRTFSGGDWKGDAVLEDYSFLINGLIDLYEAAFEPRYLESALALCDEMVSKFYDKTAGGFFMTARETKNLIARPKDAFDGAIPSANSIAALVCLRLAEITGREDLRNFGKSTFLAFWAALTTQPTSFTEMLVAFDFYSSSPKEIVISGARGSNATENFLKIIRSEFLPNSVILLADNRLQKISPLMEGRTEYIAPKEAKVYVCSNFACKLPSATPEQLLQALRE